MSGCTYDLQCFQLRFGFAFGHVKDTDGDRLTVVWRVDGLPLQTNQVPAGGIPPTRASVAFAALLTVGPHEITVTVIDSAACEASCSTSAAVSSRGDLYPIALSQASLSGIAVGGVINDIYNGVQPGNFGWLTWAGSPNEPTLVTSLTPRGNSSTYVNPRDHNDHTVSVGDWVQGKPGVSNSDRVRKALDTLETIDIVVPVWNQAINRGNNSLYRVSAFARVQSSQLQIAKPKPHHRALFGFCRLSLICRKRRQTAASPMKSAEPSRLRRFSCTD